MVTTVAMYYPRALYDADGDANSLWLWAESLRRAGVKIEVLYDGDLPIRRSLPDRAEITTRAILHRGSGRLRVPVNLCQELDRSTLLMLRSGYVLFNIVAGAAAARKGIPYVVTPMGAYDPQVRATRRTSRKIWEVAERRLVLGAQAVHVYFSQEIDHVRGLAHNARTIVAPTGFDVPDARWREQDQPAYVAWLGRYDVRHKGLDLLLDGLALLAPEHRPIIRLHGRDSKDSRAGVTRMVRERGLSDHVSVGDRIGGVEKERFLLGASAFIHPARFESYGIAIVENLAYGVPCVTTTGTNLGPDLHAAGAALIVDSSAEGVAQGLAAIASGQIDSYGPRGREFVEHDLSHENAARRFLDGIDSLRIEALT